MKLVKDFPLHIRGGHVVLFAAVAHVSGQTPATLRSLPEDEVHQLSPFEVTTDRDTAYRANNAVSSNRSNTSLFDTPQSLTVLTDAFLRDLEVLSVTEALEFVPGVAPDGAGVGGADFVQVRGQNISETLLDNMPDLNGNIRPDPIAAERVEFLKGSSSSLYGSSWPGGIINIISKKPQAKRAADFTTQFGSYNLFRQTADFTGPVNQSKTLLYRLLGAYERSDSYRNQVNSDRWTVLPSLTYFFKPGTKVTASYEYLHSRQTADPGLPIFSNETIVRLPLDRFLGLTDQDHDVFKRATHVFFDHRFSPNWSMRLGYVYTTQVADKRAGQLVGNPNLTTHLQSRRINRQYVDTGSQTAQGDLFGQFKTGALSHRLLIGFDLRKTQSDLATYLQNITPATVHVDNPAYNYTLSGVASTLNHNVAFSNSYGAYIQDHASVLNDKLQFVLGWRLDGVTQDSYTLTAPNRTSYRAPDVVTPRYAVLVHPTPSTMLYATYGESFRPDVTGRPVFGSDKKLDPTTGVLYEVGGKSRFFDSRLGLDFAVYDLTQENIVEGDPNHTGFLLQSGRQRSQGYTVEFNTDPLPGLTVFGGYAYTDGKTIDSTNGAKVGEPLPNTPKNSFSGFARYRIHSGRLQGLGLGTGLRWAGDRPGASGTKLISPGYAVVNAQASYSWRHYTFNVMVNNLFNERYRTNAAALNSNRFGTPLSFRASLRLRF